MADQSLLATMTGEHFQPVRLHYKVLNRPGLLRAFEKLRCLDYDSDMVGPVKPLLSDSD